VGILQSLNFSVIKSPSTRNSKLHRSSLRFSPLAHLSLASGKWCFLISMCLLSLSKRVHSLYFLRLFNDTITVLLMNAAILLFVTPTIKHNNYLGSLLYSLSISVKMNSLLYAPAVLLFYLQSSSLQSTIISLSICAGVQLVLGYPFLSTYPIPYLRKAFELDRVFFYKWTVNLKFLPESTFVSKPLSTFLLSLHVLSLGEAKRGAKDGWSEVTATISLFTCIPDNLSRVRFARAPHPNPFRDSLCSSQPT